ncbi:MAG: type II secretion system protein [Lachnospiraceae bacterium]|nr:type II secretion system protein [Lachnospiraceae bacterium]
MGKRDRTRAFLTEFIIVVLFFSVASVITIQLFVAASEKSNKANEIANASVIIEDTIENILATDKEADIKTDDEYTVYYDDNWTEVTEEMSKYILTVNNTVSDEEAGTLLTGKVYISDGNSEIMSATFAKYFSNGGNDNG